jgi:hypothetical protein
MDSCPPVVAFVRSSHMWGRSGSSTLVARGSTPWPQHLAPLGLGECWHSRPQGDGCCSPLPAHLVVIAVPLQVAATATSVVVIFRTPSIASTVFFSCPAPRSVVPGCGSTGVGAVAHLVETSREVLGWNRERQGEMMRRAAYVISLPPSLVFVAPTDAF